MAEPQVSSQRHEVQTIEIEPGKMARYTADIFRAAGASEAVAGRLAASLVDSNQAGHDSHGVIRVSQYVQDIHSGQLDPKAEPAVLRDGPAWTHVDGRWGFGHETARFAMSRAIEKARANGVGLASAVRCNHIGRLGEWAEQAAEARMIGLACVAMGSPANFLVAPFGGAARALSTNPIAIAAPRAEQKPLLLDFATSVSAEGKVRVARDKGAQLPAGCLIDREGNPSIDPNDLYAGGALLPLGGHKGYALSLMVDVLSQALSGADSPEMTSERGANSGACFLAIDPTAFRPFEAFSGSIDRVAQRVQAVPPAPGSPGVLLPGEPEHRTRAERASSLSLPTATWNAIAKAAESVGVSPPPS